MKLKDVRTPEIEESIKVIDKMIAEYSEKIENVNKVINTDMDTKDDEEYNRTFILRRQAYVGIINSYERDKELLLKELERRTKPAKKEEPKSWFVFVSIA